MLKGLKDIAGKAKILVRIDRLGLGNPGDAGPVGDGVSEMRIHFGPGYRVYYKKIAEKIVVLFGGDKNSQQRDIAVAKALVQKLEGMK